MRRTTDPSSRGTRRSCGGNVYRFTATVGLLVTSVIGCRLGFVHAQGADGGSAPTSPADTQLANHIQQRYGLPAVDAVRLHLWRCYGVAG